MVSDTSIKSYRETKEEGTEDLQEQIVYKAICDFQFPVCDTQLQEYTGLSISSVTARRNKLEEKGYIILSHKGKSPSTKRTVKFWTNETFR